MRWINRYNNTGSISRKKRTGDKKITTVETDKFILNLMNSKKFKLSSLKNELNKSNIIISKTTIWRRLKDNDYIYGKYINKPLLTEKQKKTRLEWAIANKNTDWHLVIFSDETTIYINKNDPNCWHIKNCREINRKNRHSIKMNIWACITLGGGLETFELFKDNLNSEKYKDILFEQLVAIYKDDYIFQQDNHSVHKSHKLVDFLSQHKVKTLEWPANSPDLNPIENLWALIKYSLQQQHLTKDNFEEKIKETINNIDFAYIFNMISSMHLRVQQVIDNKGDSINY
jgi:transposase